MASKRPAPSNDEESPLVDDPAEDATSPKAAREAADMVEKYFYVTNDLAIAVCLPDNQ